ncbi:hypothetical protein [Seonamhaeicola sp. ML3]|uniref:hypothetical protein n=1 Tax=Seonamhaeicola sp. ML3 TaxID=2937786 RepID=UPI00200DE262|nr:hypothetical protein [Seonamhaeicola sp. ML3]
MQTKILKIVGHSIYYTQSDYISFEKSNFPDLSEFKFRTHVGVLWEVEIEKYNPQNKTLTVRIIDYHSDKIDEFELQSKRNSGLVNICFVDLNWKRLQTQFLSFRKSSFKKIINNESFNDTNNDVPLETPPQGFTGLKTSSFKQAHSVPQKTTEEFYATVRFKDAKFLDGSVKFCCGIKELSEKVELEILNPQLKKEFDYIKYHFHKVFKRKSFEVIGSKIIIDYDIEFENISSPQISQINYTLIEELKNIEYSSITKLTPKENSKKLLDLNEVFDELSIDLNSGLFNESEEDLINFFLKDSNIRNKQQLVYLSGLKQSKLNNIRFSLRPNFGFLFTIKGKLKTHYCWELLDSHATYLWSINNDINNKIDIIEQIISLIGRIGRRKYKENLELPPSVEFNLIRHLNKSNGFKDWKSKLNELSQ